MSCKRAQGFLEANSLAASDITDAKKERKGRAEALALTKGIDEIVVAKGKKVVTFNMKKDPPDDKTLLSHLLGPTGNLRAPTIRKGKKLLVGFSEEAYKDVLG
jgi:arsenate reductase-like glutaredoxin family protein